MNNTLGADGLRNVEWHLIILRCYVRGLLIRIDPYLCFVHVGYLADCFENIRTQIVKRFKIQNAGRSNVSTFNAYIMRLVVR